MALKISDRSDLFPIGTTVQAFAGMANRHHDGKPSGVSLESAVVAADGTLTFAGLGEALFTLWAEVAGRNVNLLAGSLGFVAPGNLQERQRVAREAVGAHALS